MKNKVTDNKEPTPTELIGKIIAGAILFIFTIVFIGFAVLFEDARSLLLRIVSGILGELIAAILILTILWLTFNYSSIIQETKRVFELYRAWKHKKKPINK